MLAIVVSWWLLVLGAAAIAAAWFYTGGSRPYGYRALGEVSVFVFFGLGAVLGTAYVQMERLSWLALAAAIPVGLLACALLVINNLRDIPTDEASGKRTLAVVLGDRRTRLLYARCVSLPFVAASRCVRSRRSSLLTLPPCRWRSARPANVLQGAAGRELIAVLGQTGRLQLGFGVAADRRPGRPRSDRPSAGHRRCR